MVLVVCIVALATFGTTASALGTQIPHAVGEIQSALNSAGFDAGVADGIWGAKSSRAMTSFQTANGIRATGILDHATMVILFGDQVSVKSSANTSSSEASREVKTEPANQGSKYSIESRTRETTDSESSGGLWVVGIVVLVLFGLARRGRRLRRKGL